MFLSGPELKFLGLNRSGGPRGEARVSPRLSAATPTSLSLRTDICVRPILVGPWSLILALQIFQILTWRIIEVHQWFLSHFHSFLGKIKFSEVFWGFVLNRGLRGSGGCLQSSLPKASLPCYLLPRSLLQVSMAQGAGGSREGCTRTLLTFKDPPRKQDKTDDFWCSNWSRGSINNLPSSHASKGRREKSWRYLKKYATNLIFSPSLLLSPSP